MCNFIIEFQNDIDFCIEEHVMASDPKIGGHSIRTQQVVNANINASYFLYDIFLTVLKANTKLDYG
jgi:hypothetical protein